MEIFNLIRGHFALLVDQPMQTPTQGKRFHIESVNMKEGDWQMLLRISTGKTAKVYISDILRIYTFLVSSNRPVTQSEIDAFVKSDCLTQGTGSYIIPLLETFSDIEIEKEPKLTIRFVTLREQP